MQTELSFSVIFRQAINFIKNRFWQVTIISLLLALFSVFLSNYFIDASMLEKMYNPDLLKSLSQDELFYITFTSAMVTIVTSLFIGGSIIATIYNLSISPSFNIMLLLSTLLSNMLKILGFYVVYAFIIFFAMGLFLLAVFVISLILPTFLVSVISVLFIAIFVCFAMSAYYFFLGSIVEPSAHPFLERIGQLNQNLKKYWKLALLMIVIRIMATLFIALIGMMLTSNLFIAILLSTAVNLMDFVVVCFFYRLYTLITNNHPLPADVNHIDIG